MTEIRPYINSISHYRGTTAVRFWFWFFWSDSAHTAPDGTYHEEKKRKHTCKKKIEIKKQNKILVSFLSCFSFLHGRMGVRVQGE